MNLADNIKCKDGIWKLMPWIFREGTNSAIYPNIYLAPIVWDGVTGTLINHRMMAIVKHEEEHIKRQRRYGWRKWGIMYLFSSRFRLEEELVAIRSQMKYLKKHKLDFDIDRSASHLSSYLYFWCVSKKEARDRLQKVWNAI